jgi:ABC-2 type transport system permease protein
VNTARASAAASLAVVKRDILIFRSYRLRFAAQVVSGFFAVALLYYTSRLVTVAPFSEPNSYFAFAVIGLVILQVLFSTVGGIPGQVRQELVAGTFERFVVSPFGSVAAVVSMSVFPFLLATASGMVTISLAALVFGMPMRWSTVPLGIPLALLGCLAFIPFGVLGAAAVILVKQAQTGVSFLVTGISFIAGFLFPVALLPSWIRWTSEVQPFTPMVELLRNVLVGTPVTEPVWLSLFKIGLAVAVLLPLAVWTLGLAIRKSQRLGTIIEY